MREGKLIIYVSKNTFELKKMFKIFNVVAIFGKIFKFIPIKWKCHKTFLYFKFKI